MLQIVGVNPTGTLPTPAPRSVAPKGASALAVERGGEALTTDTLQARVSADARRGGLFGVGVASKGINGFFFASTYLPLVTSRRLAHTDVAFPDFSKYRHGSTLDPQKPARDSEDDRRTLPVAIYYGGSYSFFPLALVILIGVLQLEERWRCGLRKKWCRR